jgi:hypothetical protein
MNEYTKFLLAVGGILFYGLVCFHFGYQTGKY